MGNKYRKSHISLFPRVRFVRFVRLFAYKSMPYSWQIHSTAFGGSIFVVGFTPKPARTSRLLLSQR